MPVKESVSNPASDYINKLYQRGAFKTVQEADEMLEAFIWSSQQQINSLPQEDVERRYLIKQKIFLYQGCLNYLRNTSIHELENGLTK